MEKVFQSKYITMMYAVNPAMDIPQSRTGMNNRNMPRMSSMPPKNIYGFLRPHLPRVLSEMNPIIGSVIASQNFATSIMVDAAATAMPLLVMYFSITATVGKFLFDGNIIGRIAVRQIFFRLRLCGCFCSHILLPCV